MNTQLSLIIPIYNAGERIIPCLESIFAQTCHDFRLILINDGSKDETPSIIRNYLAHNQPEWLSVSFIDQTNHGVSYTRNRGVMLADTTYVGFIDQDDYVTPDYCEEFLSAAKDHDYDIIIGGYERVTEKGVLRKVPTTGLEWDIYNQVTPWGRIFRRDFLIEHNIQFLTTHIGEDIYYNLVAYSYTDRILCIPKNSSYKWTFNTDSVSNSKQKVISKENNPLFLLKQIHKDFSSDNHLSYDLRKYFFFRYIIWFILFTLRKSQRDTVKNTMEELFRWLSKEYPDYLENPYFSHKPKGESTPIYFLVRLIRRLHLWKLDTRLLPLLAKQK